ncbi:DUF5416 family protein [Campylobacter sp.]|uniref:DUF5416 family protein n=1 Tax=Campylobacter sp. TaxID=205 RepID=UPI0026F63D59|nr:DUF5416 family protein [Campylobacter sp.]
MKTKAFEIQEGESQNIRTKSDMATAFYSGKFSQYIITKSHMLKDSLIVTDMVSLRDKVDIVNSSIKELVFSDCVKKFDEIWAEFENLSENNGLNADKNFKPQPLDSAKNNYFIYKLKDDIEIPEGIVKSVKIFINGYDESSESLNLDLQMLDEKSEYKYKIMSDAIEISLITDIKSNAAKNFLKTFTYKKIASGPKSMKEIYLIINDKLLYKTKIEI